MPLQAVAPQRLYRQIAEQLRVLIGNGEFATGTRLPAERDLAKQLGVSRPSVREALIALEVAGWVEVRSGSGVYVQERKGVSNNRTTISDSAAAEWGPLELIRARRVVEGETAAIAARLAKRRDTDAMRAAIDQMAAYAADGVMPLDGDRAFHTAVVQASGNSVLVETVQAFWDSRRGPVFERLGGHFETAPSWRAAIGEHEVVLAAVRARDASAARDAMHSHMDKAHARFSASWRRANKT
ncbi:MAG: FadR family transcriptional regulator [Rhodoferax sp.]|nr:FadR family transcriptional regulator [Rhodoferax sp.]